MNLYFSPMACSLASRIALYEAGAAAQFTQVDLKAKRTVQGADFFALTAMGQVPALRTDDGTLVTENSAVLQYIADRFPQAQLAPATVEQRAQLQQWLGFIGTELHKSIFNPLFDLNAPEAVKQYSRAKIPLRFGVLQNHLAQREFLLERFSVADAYLTTILNWTAVTAIDLAEWPAVAAYHQRMIKRPSIAKAFSEEYPLFKEEQARQAQA